MKIFEGIVDGRIRDIVHLSSNLYGFVASCGTIDAIHSAHLLLKKHLEKQKPVHIALLDLEKAFDRVPREVVPLRHREVPEELIDWNLDGVYHLCRSTPVFCTFATRLCCRHGCRGRGVKVLVVNVALK
ncbi:unnamed protein product [Heligmosomoides polygyrus]|uniref:Reverse transcriptase domain-containing protein n=1 Tax=Heligmosomoides polygyrus TaxID=6339 RepID=A0A183GJ92_HELPZ|nr:unnamed protein product [Heligmosomoides polygyrus]